MITGTKNVAGVPAAQRQPRERQQRRRQKRKQQSSEGKEGHHDGAPPSKMRISQELDDAIVIDIVGRKGQPHNKHASTAANSLEPSRHTGNTLRHVDIRI